MPVIEKVTKIYFSEECIMSKKVAVVCANGRVGKLVVKEAVERGLDVTAFVKGENQSVAKKSVDKDLFDITKADLAGFDVVVDAFGAWKEEDLHLHSESLKHLCDLLSGTETRLIYVGGAGSLYVAPDKMLYQTPDFPAVYLPLATAQVKTYFELKERKDVKWTFVSPAADFQADGERTGKYILAGDNMTVNANGESIISYADYAIALVDEIVSGNHIQERISLVRE